MNTKTLHIIQTLSKIGKILCRVLFIFCIIGFAGCVVGIICMALIPGGFKIGGVTIHGLIEKNAAVSIGTAYTAMATGAVFCAGEAVLCRFAETYFRHELAAGTPFTFEGAKEMMRLGILTICIPIGTAIVAGILYAIMAAAFSNVSDIKFSDAFSVGLGVMFIVMSLICKHGAEIAEGRQNEPIEE